MSGQWALYWLVESVFTYFRGLDIVKLNGRVALTFFGLVNSDDDFNERGGAATAKPQNPSRAIMHIGMQPIFHQQAISKTRWGGAGFVWFVATLLFIGLFCAYIFDFPGRFVFIHP